MFTLESKIKLHICNFLNVGIVYNVFRSPTYTFHFVTMNPFANFLYSDFANFLSTMEFIVPRRVHLGQNPGEEGGISTCLSSTLHWEQRVFDSSVAVKRHSGPTENVLHTLAPFARYISNNIENLHCWIEG